MYKTTLEINRKVTFILFEKIFWEICDCSLFMQELKMIFLIFISLW